MNSDVLGNILRNGNRSGGERQDGKTGTGKLEDRWFDDRLLGEYR